MTEKITTIYQGNHHVLPKFEVNISLTGHYEELRSVRGQCISVGTEASEHKPIVMVMEPDNVSCGAQWDFYSHQHPIKVQPPL